MSKALIDAAASYFGMDPAQLAQGSMSTNSEGLRFTFIVQCQDDDYLGIADRMRAMREPVDSDEHSAFVQLPTVQEVMRDPVAYMDQPECRELMKRACSLSKDVLHKVEDEIARRGDARVYDSYPGTGGRTVKHVDAPDEEDTGLPEAVWLDAKDTTQAQRQMASDRGGDNERFLVQVAMLTPEQLAKAVKP